MTYNVAIIPARGGSKRIPRKNIRLFNGKPIISWTILCLMNSGIFNRIIVSTDDPEIQSISIDYGAECPFLRPKELSGDYTLTQDVVLHLLDFLQSHHDVNLLACAYPTAPLLLPDDVIRAASIVQCDHSAFAFVATEYSHPIQRGFRLMPDGKAQMLNPASFATRTQDIEKIYHDAGMLYVAMPHIWRERLSTYTGTTPILLPNYRAHDIDNLDDWKRVELIASALFAST